MWHFARPHIYLVAVINQYKGWETNNFMVKNTFATQLELSNKAYNIDRHYNE